MVRWSFAKVKLQSDQNCDLTEAKSWQMGQYSFKRCCYIVYDHKVNLMQPSRKEFINGVGSLGGLGACPPVFCILGSLKGTKSCHYSQHIFIEMYNNKKSQAWLHFWASFTQSVIETKGNRLNSRVKERIIFVFVRGVG